MPMIYWGKAPKELENELRFLLAVKLFELHRLSLGKADELSNA
jgi:predicted HTH domain antitoxin